MTYVEGGITSLRGHRPMGFSLSRKIPKRCVSPGVVRVGVFSEFSYVPTETFLLHIFWFSPILKILVLLISKKWMSLIHHLYQLDPMLSLDGVSCRDLGTLM
jgi:hypothetical protein